jgi:hypothetical protein
MSRKHRHSAGESGRPGTQRLLHHLDCMWSKRSFRVHSCNELRCRYILSVLIHRIFTFRCNMSLLRFTVTLTLLTLPLFLTRLLAFHQRRRPPPLLAPTAEALILSTFPIAWFYGFLYYTEVPSLVSVLFTMILATQDRHWSAAVVRPIHQLVYCKNSSSKVISPSLV